jgi:hypothetical protein
MGIRYAMKFGGGPSVAAVEAPIVKDPALQVLLVQYAEVFSMQNGKLRESKLAPAEINTEGGPIRQKAYRVPFQKREVVKTEVQKMLDQGVIEASCSPWSSPITLVPKKDGEVRFCVDYRRLNSITS